MSETVPRGAREIEDVFLRQSDAVYRVCFAYMKNAADAEDMTQTAFLQFIRKAPFFENERHERAWLIRTASNLCKNALKHWWRKREDVSECETPSEDRTEIDEVLEAVRALPDKYKTPVYLHYYEGYSGEEIAEMLGRPASTVRNQLRDARSLLKKKLGGDPDEE